ncbi:MAG: outer membrane beta-barrel protein [Ignavibacteria bacterium]|nr:outer membrane beta-barrel protein [Ignavibacteria bacterium]
MRTFIIAAAAFSLLTIKISEAQSISIGNGFSIIPSVNYVSSATIQLDAFNLNQFERSITEELSGGYGYGISIRKKLFDEDLSFGFSTEYTRIYDDELTQTFQADSSRARGRVTEELWIVPVEFTGYFNIPNFTDDIEIYLGGGIGVYFGDRVRTIQNIQSKTISRESSFSFVILSGMELMLAENISGVFEIRFRQGEYSVKSEFPVSSISVAGIQYPLEKNLNSKIFVDGLKLSLGIAYNF